MLYMLYVGAMTCTVPQCYSKVSKQSSNLNEGVEFGLFFIFLNRPQIKQKLSTSLLHPPSCNVVMFNNTQLLELTFLKESSIWLKKATRKKKKTQC